MLKTAEVRFRLPDDPIDRPEDWSKILMTSTMDNRCAVLEGFGGKFYVTVLGGGEHVPNRYRKVLRAVDIMSL